MKYAVTIRATFIKTYTIDADSKDEAIMTANDQFDVNDDHTYENYDQETIEVRTVEETKS